MLNACNFHFITGSTVRVAPSINASGAAMSTSRKRSHAGLRRHDPFVLLRHSVSHLSQTALIQVLQAVREIGIPEHVSAGTAGRATTEFLRDTPYGPMLHRVKLSTCGGGPDHDMLVVNPFSYMHACMNVRDSGFRRLMLAKMREHPPSAEKPWRLALYADEIGQ